MNKVLIIGNLTRDPELLTTSNDNSVCKFTIAANRKFKNANGEYDVDFINCVAWRKTGEFINKYFNKGKKIAVEGMIQTRKYEDKQGNNRTAVDVVVDQAEFVESPKKQQIKADDLEPIEDDDLPF